MNVMRKVFLVAIMVMFAQGALALELPDTCGEWRCVGEHILPLVADANGEELGRMVWRDYERESPKGSVQVILSEGTGTGGLYVPDSVNDSHGALPAESGYRLLTLAGCPAILEVHSYIPLALAVKAGDNVVLTIESPSLSESEIAGFAEEILSSWKHTESDSFPAP